MKLTFASLKLPFHVYITLSSFPLHNTPSFFRITMLKQMMNAGESQYVVSFQAVIMYVWKRSEWCVMFGNYFMWGNSTFGFGGMGCKERWLYFFISRCNDLIMLGAADDEHLLEGCWNWNSNDVSVHLTVYVFCWIFIVFFHISVIFTQAVLAFKWFWVCLTFMER